MKLLDRLAHRHVIRRAVVQRRTKVEACRVVAYVSYKVVGLVVLQGSLVKHQVRVRRDGRGLDKNYILAFAHFPGFWMVDAKGRAVRAVSDEASFPSASI